MSERIGSGQQDQVRLALSQLQEVTKLREIEIEGKPYIRAETIFEEEAIAIIEKNIQEVPLNKRAEIANNIRLLAQMKLSRETEEAHSKLGWIQLIFDRCIHFFKGHGAVTSSEWAQHVADELQAAHRRIAPIQKHFQEVKPQENLLPPNVLAALTRLSPEEIKKATQEDVFNIERLRDLGLYQQFKDVTLFSLMTEQKNAFEEGLSWRESHYVEDLSAQEKRLKRAIESGDKEYALFLLNKMPSVGIQVVEKSNNDFLNLVLSSGKVRDINESSIQHCTALYIAVIKGREETVRLLLAAGATPLLETNPSSAPMWPAIHGQKWGILKQLCANLSPGKINMLDKAGKTLLYYAIKYENQEIAEFLIEKGANPNFGEKNSTPLLAAIEHGDEKMITLLINHGAFITAEEQLAAHSKNPQIITLVEEQLRKQDRRTSL
jgi:hypothetical protein